MPPKPPSRQFDQMFPVKLDGKSRPAFVILKKYYISTQKKLFLVALLIKSMLLNMTFFGLIFFSILYKNTISLFFFTLAVIKLFIIKTYYI